MKKLLLMLVAVAMLVPAMAQKIDTAIVSKIKKTGLENSQVMETLMMLTDVNGPRLTNSPGYKKGANYAKKTLEGMGLSNVHFDTWGEFGKGWSVKNYNLSIISPSHVSVISYPKAWSPGVKGTVTAEVVYLNIKTEADLEKYKGKLKGKIVLFNFPIIPKPHFEAEATRIADSTLLKMSNAGPTDRSSSGSRRFPAGTPEQLTYKKWKLCESEGVLAVLDCSRGDHGTLYAQGASVPVAPETPSADRPRVYAATAPKILPQITVASEHYNRMVRLIEHGEIVKLELTMNTEFTPTEEGFNVIAEIPGTDKKDEVVMMGAHLDSWHSGTGTTDNAVGVAICMEAMRILKSLNIQPSKTIRIGLWAGEEQGLLGSRGYVKKHLGTTADGKTTVTAEAEKFSVYFNTDNGTGKWRGVQLQGNENARPTLREWLRPFEKGSGTLTLNNTGSTDHVPFDAIGLPGFQFITDPIEYFTRTWHSNMDSYDRAIEADMKYNATLLAHLVWTAANQQGLFPRKEVAKEEAPKAGTN